MLLARYPLFLDRIGYLAITQQAGADVVIVGINANDVAVIFTHRVVVLTGKYEAVRLGYCRKASSIQGERFV
jgi:hypothetical protein